MLQTSKGPAVFRLARRSEAEAIYEMYRAAVGSPFCAWDEFYPGREEVEADLASDGLFVLERDGEILGAISISPENEDDEFDCWTVRDNAHEFSRVVIASAHRGEGLSKLLVEGVLREFRQRGVPAVHISVSKGNLPAIRLYRRFGFAFLGEAEQFGGEYWLCEKRLSDEPGQRHMMRLQPGPFEQIKNGTKTIEMRLYDEKRAKIAVGDRIVFVQNATGGELECEVTGLYRYPSFEELYRHHDKGALGYAEEEPADPADMLTYYDKSDIEQYGVVGIEIKKL